MGQISKNRWVALGLFVFLLLTFCLGSYGLLEDNEARFFEIAWEMQRSGDWLVPHLNFISHFHKPPGTFWLVGGSLKLFGESEWAGRVPVAVASLFTLAFVGMLARLEGTKAESYRAILILVTSVEFWFLSRLVLTDMFLTVSVTAAMFFAWGSRRAGGSKNWVGFWLSLAAAALFKGPVGIALVAPILLTARLWSKESASWNLRPLLGMALFFAISLPWYGLVCVRFDGLWQYFLNFQTAQRVLTTVHGRGGPWWFYAPVLLAGFFPWSVSLPRAVLGAFRRAEDFDRFLLLWMAYPLLLFSFSGSKLPTYLLPIFPALALLVARHGRIPGALKSMGTTTLWSVAVFTVAVAVYLKIGVSKEIAPAFHHLLLLVAFGVVGVLGTLMFRRRMSEGTWFEAGGWIFGGLLLVLASALGPSDPAYSARHLSTILLKTQPMPSIVGEVSDHLHGLPYYLKRRIPQIDYHRETQFEHPDDYRHYLFPDIPSFLADIGPSATSLLVIRRSDYEAHANPEWRVDEAGSWLLLQPHERATTDPASQETEDRQNSRPVGGDSHIQRGGQPGKPRP